MTRARFEKVHKLTADFEGTWSNHAKDPGGKTMYGITEATYHDWLREQGRRARAVRLISREEAVEIYYTRYWLPAGCDKLHLGVDRMVYDAAVNSGVGQARRWLIASIGGTDAKTIAAIASRRLAFLRRLNTWPVFGKGWTRRVNAMKEVALQDFLLPLNPYAVKVAPPVLVPIENAKGLALWSAIARVFSTVFRSLTK